MSSTPNIYVYHIDIWLINSSVCIGCVSWEADNEMELSRSMVGCGMFLGSVSVPGEE